jgi:hypothetical protein
MDPRENNTFLMFTMGAISKMESFETEKQRQKQSYRERRRTYCPSRETALHCVR